ncbi:MAG: hypothetical protein J6Y19_04845 [Kiritimatiellae bacterium]|nr:hypothetical protein [Kiritimatiellia bacterium]
MPIDSSTLLRLDPNKSYYLSNTTGEIKEAGVVQWLRCKLGIGGGRTKAAALAERIKTALLAEAAATSDSQLEADIGALNTKISLSGRKLRDIALKFTTKKEAVRSLEKNAAKQVDTRAENGEIVHPAPASKDFLKKALVYVGHSIIQEACGDRGPGVDVDTFVHRKAFRLFALTGFWEPLLNAAEYAKDHIPGFPVEQLPGDGADDPGMPAMKLDEVHFRVLLACMFDDEGKPDMAHLTERLAKYTENDIQALKDEILAVPLKSPMDPDAVPDFRKAMDDLFYYNRPAQGSGGPQDDFDPRNIEQME